MIKVYDAPSKITSGLNTLPSYLTSTSNMDLKTVESFGHEWESFSKFSKEEIDNIGKDYFDIVPQEFWSNSKSALDVGCGSGRWTRYVSTRMGSVYSIDPSSAAFVAQKNCSDLPNVTVIHAGVSNLPFPPEQFDLVFSLGVLHHVPNTSEAIRDCVKHVKPGGLFLVYLYYALDNRGLFFRTIFEATNIFRQIICKLPNSIKNFICDLIAIFICLPLAVIAKSIASNFGANAAGKIPLNYYRNTSFFVMRNDSRDRFGTPLEQRFSKTQIHDMLKLNGLTEITFSNKQPFWVATCRKPE